MVHENKLCFDLLQILKFKNKTHKDLIIIVQNLCVIVNSVNNYPDFLKDISVILFSIISSST